MNKASGGDGIPAELFQILKDDAGKELHSVRQLSILGKLKSGHRPGKFILIPKKSNAKECSDYYAIALMSHVSKVKLQIL